MVAQMTLGSSGPGGVMFNFWISTLGQSLFLRAFVRMFCVSYIIFAQTAVQILKRTWKTDQAPFQV